MAFTAKIADLIAEDKSGLLTKHASWERIQLSDVAEILNGAPFDSSKFNTAHGVPLARIRDVIAGETSTYYSGNYEDTYLLRQGDLLIGMDGDFNTGYWGTQVALLNQRVCKISPLADFYEKKLLGYVLPGYLAAINANTPSITVKHLSSKTVGEIELPLPPRAEQTRIVEKLEELLSDLGAGVAELKAAQRKLAEYRQSLLKAAVEGALTADWRAAQNTSSRRRPGPSRSHEDQPQQRDPGLRRDDEGKETGAELLQRILSERRARWEQKQLAKFAEQSKTPPKGWQDKYPEPVAPDLTDLPPLPEGWVWATLSQIGWLDRGRSQHRPRNAPHLYGGPYPFVQTGDIRHANTFLYRVSATYSEDGLAQSRLWPSGTMCITIAANIGKTAILGMDACFPDSIVGFLPASGLVSIRYVEYFMRTAQQALEDQAPATAQKNINIEILERLCLPLPPFEEQCLIAGALEEMLRSSDMQDAAIFSSLNQSAAQRKNILKTAFSGQLVPQDPNDEPASELLARIRAECISGQARKPHQMKKKSRKAV